MIISDSPPEISDCIFESLAYYKLEIDNVILSNRTSILDYLAALKVDLFFSSDLNLDSGDPEDEYFSWFSFFRSDNNP